MLSEKLRHFHQQKIMDCRIEKLQAFKKEVFFQKENEKMNGNVIKRCVGRSPDKLTSTNGSATRLGESVGSEVFYRTKPKIYLKINKCISKMQTIDMLKKSIRKQDVEGEIKNTKHIVTRDNLDMIQLEMKKKSNPYHKDSSPFKSISKSKTTGETTAITRPELVNIDTFSPSKPSKSAVKNCIINRNEEELQPDDSSAAKGREREDSAIPKYIMKMNQTASSEYQPHYIAPRYKQPALRIRPKVLGGNLQLSHNSKVKYLRNLSFPIQVFDSS